MSETVRRALEFRVTSYRKLAEQLGVSEDALRSWRHERREPHGPNLRRLAELLTEHSAELRVLAAELREEAALRRRRSA